MALAIDTGKIANVANKVLPGLRGSYEVNTIVRNAISYLHEQKGPAKVDYYVLSEEADKADNKRF